MRRRRINPSDPSPLYMQVAEILREKITRGEYKVGELLPAERKLADTYQVGHDTIRDALAVLRREGLIVTRPGQGSLVPDHPTPTVIPVGPGVSIHARMPTEDERRRMGLPEGVPVFVLVRQGLPDEVIPGGPGTLLRTQAEEPENPEQSAP